MARKYEVDIFDLEQLKNFEMAFGNLKKALQSEQFMIFIADKCMKELNNIIDTNLRTENYTTDYRSNNNYETTKDQVRIFNDSMVDLSEVSEKTLQNYPEGLSLAKLIEFGTGIPGTDSDEFEWKTEFNPDRDYNKGWVYERDGQLHWTKGQEGHFIYQKLLNAVQENIESWVLEYMNLNLD